MITATKRFSDNAAATYDLNSLPSFINFKVMIVDGQMTPSPEGTKWGSLAQPPAIGDKVTIGFNGLGTGTVESYFVEHSWLGVCVKLDKIPDWKAKQCKTNADVALVFAPEIGL